MTVNRSEWFDDSQRMVLLSKRQRFLHGRARARLHDPEVSLRVGLASSYDHGDMLMKMVKEADQERVAWLSRSLG